MKRDETAIGLLTSCSARLDTDAGPQGTAFIVSPGYAVTAAHVIGGAEGRRSGSPKARAAGTAELAVTSG
jgi:hypothetical protein